MANSGVNTNGSQVSRFVSKLFSSTVIIASQSHACLYSSFFVPRQLHGSTTNTWCLAKWFLAWMSSLPLSRLEAKRERHEWPSWWQIVASWGDFDEQTHMSFRLQFSLRFTRSSFVRFTIRSSSFVVFFDNKWHVEPFNDGILVGALCWHDLHANPFA